MINLLIISLEPLTKEGSNSKAISSFIDNNMFSIGQIYFKSGTPNNLDGQYLYIPENRFVKNIFGGKKYITTVEKNDNCEQNTCFTTHSRKIKKTPFKCICRNLLWKNFISHNMTFIQKWVYSFKPQVIMIQDCDIPYFYKFSLKISKKFNVPIIFFTSENYSLKKNNYMGTKNTLFFKFFQKKLRNEQRKVLNTSINLFLTKSLLDEYSANFKLSSKNIVLKPGIDLTIPNHQHIINDKEKTICYCGSVGVGRLESIIKFSKIVGSEYCIKLFGRLDDAQIKSISNIRNIRYNGFVNYKTALEEISLADAVLLTESFDQYIQEDCKHAFSGKIAESLLYNGLVIYYGPENACHNFLKENKCALILNENFEKKQIDELFFSEGKQKELLLNTQLVLSKYFDENKNKNTFSKVVEETINV